MSKGAVLAIGFATAPAFARLTQTLAASVTGRDFVAAARVAGVGRIRLLRRHILPNIGEPLVVNATIGASPTYRTWSNRPARSPNPFSPASSSFSKAPRIPAPPTR